MHVSYNMSVLHECLGLKIVMFTCAHQDPNEVRVGRVTTGHALVFPWTCGLVTREGLDPIVADSTRVMMYNLGDQYARRHLSAADERAVMLVYDASTIIEAAKLYEPAAVDHPQRPWSFAHGPSHAVMYMMHYALFRAARTAECDEFVLHEQSLQLLNQALAGAYAARGWRLMRVADQQRRRARRHAEEVRCLLAARFTERMQLPQVAAQVGLSPFHLARLFREETGMSMHGFRNRLRLHAALTMLGDRGTELAELALILGYSSQSHLTSQFSRYFGRPPGVVRRLVRAKGQCLLRRILKDRLQPAL